MKVNLEILRSYAPTWEWSARRFGAGWSYIGIRGQSVVGVRSQNEQCEENVFATRWYAHHDARVTPVEMWLLTSAQLVQCAECSGPVDSSRLCYATPICFHCLPPPRPLPIVSATARDCVSTGDDSVSDAIAGLAGIADRLKRSGYPDERKLGAEMRALLDVITANNVITSETFMAETSEAMDRAEASPVAIVGESGQVRMVISSPRINDDDMA